MSMNAQLRMAVANIDASTAMVDIDANVLLVCNCIQMENNVLVSVKFIYFVKETTKQYHFPYEVMLSKTIATYNPDRLCLI